MAMALRSLSAPLLISTIFPFLSIVLAEDVPTTCYVLDGDHKSDAGFRCDNSTTGHSSCCQMGAICYSNGVCQQDNSGFQDYLRVGCTDPTWKDPACLNQCKTVARGSTAGIRFCNGAITSTSDYCCDTGEFGIGSFDCCNHPKSIFGLQVATLVAQIPLNPPKSTSTTSSSSTSTSTTSTSTTSSSSSSSSSPPTPTPPIPQTNTPSSSSNHDLTIGLAVGIPLALLVCGLLFFILRRRSREQKKKENRSELPGTQGGIDYHPLGAGPREVLGSIPMNNKPYYAGRTYNGNEHELPARHEMVRDQGPQELPAQERAVELQIGGGRG